MKFSGWWSHFGFEPKDRTWWFNSLLDSAPNSTSVAVDYWNGRRIIEPKDPDDVNLISSLTETGMHKPVIDLDGFDVRVVPSTTPGNQHLYIDKDLTWEQYAFLLTALNMVGLVQDGFLKYSLRRGASFVRPPWVKKRRF